MSSFLIALLFLKMDEERVTQRRSLVLPKDARRDDIKDLSGEALSETYAKLLETTQPDDASARDAYSARRASALTPDDAIVPAFCPTRQG